MNTDTSIKDVSSSSLTEFADQSIRVNCVCPCITDTDIHADGSEASRVECLDLGKLMPRQRAGQPKEVVNIVAWLLSGDASYTTDAFLDVASGRL